MENFGFWLAIVLLVYIMRIDDIAMAFKADCKPPVEVLDEQRD